MKARDAIFLQTLIDKGKAGSARLKDLRFVDEAENRARQSCRQQGWAVFGTLNNTGPNQWHITEAGFRALQEYKERHQVAKSED